MAKIIAINGEVVTIGTDDGGITEVRPSDLNFAPQIGDRVEIYKTETRTIISKVEDKSANQGLPAGGININMNNNQAVTQTGQPTLMANGQKAVNKVVYCLLAFFLGGIGGHKFYSGRTGSGILYLIFCWTFIPGFIALIELIVALCKKADANGMILV